MIPYGFLAFIKFIEESLELEETGQTLVEYALLLLFIAIAVVGAVTLLGGNLGEAYQRFIDAWPP